MVRSNTIAAAAYIFIHLATNRKRNVKRWWQERFLQIKNGSITLLADLKFQHMSGKCKYHQKTSSEFLTEQWPVQSLSKWKHSSNTWEDITYEEGCCCLLIKASQLLMIETKNTISTVLDSVCLFGTGGEVKAKHKNEYLGIQVMKSQGNFAQFIKIRLANSLEKSALDNCNEVVDELKRFIPVTDPPTQKVNKIEEDIATLPQLMREILNSSVSNDSELVLPVGIVEKTVEELFMDPGCVAFFQKIWGICKNIEEGN